MEMADVVMQSSERTGNGITESHYNGKASASQETSPHLSSRHAEQGVALILVYPPKFFPKKRLQQ
jgi:hypothetical protein